MYNMVYLYLYSFKFLLNRLKSFHLIFMKRGLEEITRVGKPPLHLNCPILLYFPFVTSILWHNKLINQKYNKDSSIRELTCVIFPHFTKSIYRTVERNPFSTTYNTNLQTRDVITS